MHLTRLLGGAPAYIIPKLSAVLVDSQWNIVTKANVLVPPPSTQEDRNAFVESPSSLYSKIKDRMARRHRYLVTEYYADHYWYILEDLLIQKSESIRERVRYRVANWKNYETLLLQLRAVHSKGTQR